MLNTEIDEGMLALFINFIVGGGAEPVVNNSEPNAIPNRRFFILCSRVN